MTKQLLTAAAALALLALLGAPTPPANADDKKPADPTPAKESKTSDTVEAISSAYQMALMGRDAKSPEMLIGAAVMLRQISAKPGDAEAKDPKGEKVKPAEGDFSPQTVAKGWLNEAAEMAPKDKLIADLVKRLLDTEAQGSLGGPRQYNHAPGAGTTINWGVTFTGGNMATAVVTQNGTRNSITIELYGPRGGLLASQTGVNPRITWTPDVTKAYTISVTNNGPGAAAYSLYHN